MRSPSAAATRRCASSRCRCWRAGRARRAARARATRARVEGDARRRAARAWVPSDRADLLVVLEARRRARACASGDRAARGCRGAGLRAAGASELRARGRADRRALAGRRRRAARALARARLYVGVAAARHAAPRGRVLAQLRADARRLRPSDRAPPGARLPDHRHAHGASTARACCCTRRPGAPTQGLPFAGAGGRGLRGGDRGVALRRSRRRADPRRPRLHAGLSDGEGDARVARARASARRPRRGARGRRARALRRRGRRSRSPPASAADGLRDRRGAARAPRRARASGARSDASGRARGRSRAASRCPPSTRTSPKCSRAARGARAGRVPGKRAAQARRAARSSRGCCSPRSSPTGTAASASRIRAPDCPSRTVLAQGTEEQKERFLGPFLAPDRPRWACFAMTEPGAGSDAAAIRTIGAPRRRRLPARRRQVLHRQRAAAPTGSWCRRRSIRAKGREAQRAFFVERGTPGLGGFKIEKKMGLKAYESTSFTLERLPRARGEPARRRGAQERRRGLRDGDAHLQRGAPDDRRQRGRHRARRARRGARVRARARPAAATRACATASSRCARKLRMARLLCLRAGWLADAERPEHRRGRRCARRSPRRSRRT